MSDAPIPSSYDQIICTSALQLFVPSKVNLIYIRNELISLMVKNRAFVVDEQSEDLNKLTKEHLQLLGESLLSFSLLKQNRGKPESIHARNMCVLIADCIKSKG